MIGGTLYSWNGSPALKSQDGWACFIVSPNTVWIGATDKMAIALATIRAEAISIRGEEFDALVRRHALQVVRFGRLVSKQ